MFDPEEARYEEAARHDRFDGWDDIDNDFELLCDNQAALADEPPMTEAEIWQAWQDLQNDPDYQADFPEPDGVYCA